MDAIIISGYQTQSQKKVIATILRERAIEPYNVSILTLAAGEYSIGIKDVRVFLRTLHMSSFGPGGRAAVIETAELMTAEAQQALLKTLEEPPPHTLIILETQNYDRLLPTVISRCQIIPSPIIPEEKDERFILPLALEFLRVSPGTIRYLVDSGITSPQLALQCIEQTLVKIHEGLPDQANTSDRFKEFTALGKALLRAIDQLRANASYKLVLDNLTNGEVKKAQQEVKRPRP